MINDHDDRDDRDDGFELDLRGYGPRRGRARSYEIADPFAMNSSPLDHYLMIIAPCVMFASEAADREGCKRWRWAEHLRFCDSCARSELYQRLLKIQARRRAAREAAS